MATKPSRNVVSNQYYVRTGDTLGMASPPSYPPRILLTPFHFPLFFSLLFKLGPIAQNRNGSGAGSNGSGLTEDWYSLITSDLAGCVRNQGRKYAEGVWPNFKYVVGKSPLMLVTAVGYSWILGGANYFTNYL